MKQIDSLPVIVSREQRDNPYIISSIAQRAFRLANFDFAPDDAVTAAIDRGMIEVVEYTEDAVMKHIEPAPHDIQKSKV